MGLCSNSLLENSNDWFVQVISETIYTQGALYEEKELNLCSIFSISTIISRA